MSTYDYIAQWSSGLLDAEHLLALALPVILVLGSGLRLLDYGLRVAVGGFQLKKERG